MKIDPETFLHRQRVIARKRQIELMKLDNELPDTQIYTPYFRGTHPKPSLLSIITRTFKEILP